MSWERFFFYLNRFNAVAFCILIVGVAVLVAYESLRQAAIKEQWTSDNEESSFGADFEPANSIIGQAVKTSAGEFVAYYNSDESNERKEQSGLVIVSSKSSKTLPIAVAGEELLIDFDFLFDQGADEPLVIGYIARVASEANYRAGKFDLVIGALPAMTKNVVARDVRYTDLPQVRSDGTIGVILWHTEEAAEIVGFRLNDGSVIDRARIDLPIIREDRVSQGPGRATDPTLLRDPDYGKAPRNSFVY